MTDYKREMPEIEEFVDWLYDRADHELPPTRVLREVLSLAYLKGQSTKSTQPEGESNPCVVRWGQSMMVVETLADVDALAEVLRHSLSFKEPSTPQLLTPRDDA
jgi:hypothetical protein